MKCSFCGNEFDDEAARKQCTTCALFSGCKKVKCPHCGYEAPAEPPLIKWIKKRILRTHAETQH